jgi:hypothetical protein
MTTTTQRHSSDADKAVLDLQVKFDRLLAKTKPSKREQIQGKFRDLYPNLEAHLVQGKTLKEVLAAFNGAIQSSVCMRTFKEMLAAERSRYDQEGKYACCHYCGQSLIGADGSASNTRPLSKIFNDTIKLEDPK